MSTNTQTPPSLKRRRLNPQTAAAATLSKPFKSPFKTPRPTAATPQPAHPTSSTTPTTPTPTNLISLQKRHTALLNTLAALRASLDTHTQALAIETGARETELEGLVLKWRGVSRAAAEGAWAVGRERCGEGEGGMGEFLAGLGIKEGLGWDEEGEGWVD